jgi:hypothetical protein
MEARFDENGIVLQLRSRAKASGQYSDFLRGAFSFRLVDHLDGLGLNLFGHLDQRRLLRQR